MRTVKSNFILQLLNTIKLLLTKKNIVYKFLNEFMQDGKNKVNQSIVNINRTQLIFFVKFFSVFIASFF